MSSDGRLLILGLGNLLMGDDGVGVHVINSFQQESLPDGVDIVDGGTGGLDLVDIISGYRRVIVVDAVRGENGSLSGVRLFSPDDLCEKKEGAAYSMHDMELGSVLDLMKRLRMDIPDLSIVGIPATDIAPGTGLSGECRGHLPEAIELVKKTALKWTGRGSVEESGKNET